MRLSRFLYIGLLTISTTSCSSMYDVWQGYDDIEPASPEEQVFQTPSQTRSELDEVVARATLDNNFVQSSNVERKNISSANLEEIYKRAEMQAELSSLEEIEIPELPPISMEKILPYMQTEQPVSQEIEATDIVISSQTEDVIVEDAISVESYQPTNDVVVNDDTIIIGVTEPSATSYNDQNQTEYEYQPLVSEDDYSYSTHDDIGETVIIGGEATQTDTNTDGAIIIGEDLNNAPAIQDIEIAEAMISGTTVLADEIKYNRGSDRLSTNDVKKLRAIVAKYKKNPSNVLVMGYAINKDSNLGVDKAMELMDLATRRADKVAANLVKHGIDVNHISVSADALDASDGNDVKKKDVTEIFFSY